MNQNEHEIIRAMEVYGGGFIKQLARLYQHADSDNQKKLKDAFPEYWAKYEEIASIKLVKP